MPNITIKTHNPNESKTVLKLSTEDVSVSTITADNQTNYELIDNATGLAPNKVAIRQVGDDMHLSFNGSDTDTNLIIKDYYNHTAQAIVGQTQVGVYRSYLPVSGTADDYVSQVEDLEKALSESSEIDIAQADPALITTDDTADSYEGDVEVSLEDSGEDSAPLWTQMQPLGSYLWVLGLAPVAANLLDDDSDGLTNPPVVTITHTTDFTAGDSTVAAGDVVASYDTDFKGDYQVMVVLSDTVNYALDGLGNVVLTEDGALLVQNGSSLPDFSLTPYVDIHRGDNVTVEPTVNATASPSGVMPQDVLQTDDDGMVSDLIAQHTTVDDHKGGAADALLLNDNLTVSDVMNHANTIFPDGKNESADSNGGSKATSDAQSVGYQFSHSVESYSSTAYDFIDNSAANIL